MAITPINNRYPGFIFDGENSRDYGVYITDVEVFGAPKRKVQMISIPGRNGDYALDEGSFENITVKYECVLGAGSESDFNDGISDFRNWLASKVGYKTLSDEINTGEFRKAVFIDGMEVPTLNKKTGTFDVLFDCKPQRFLKSGEIPRTIGGAVTNTQTKSGTVISIDSDGGDKATSLIATIEAVQDGSGDPSPDNARAITGWTAANVNVTGKNLIDFKSLLDKWGSGYTDLGDDSYNVTSTGAGYREPFRFASEDIDVTLSGEITQLSGSAGWRLQLLNSSDEAVATLGAGSTMLSGMGCKLRLNFSTAGAGANYKNIQLELGTTATAFEPYTGKTYPVSFGSAGTVYGGTVDIVTGTLTVTHKAETFDGTEAWASGTISGSPYFYLNLSTTKMVGRKSGGLGSEMLCNWLKPTNTGTDNIVWVGSSGGYINVRCSSASDLAAFKSMLTATPLVVVYPLETPQTYTLTAQEVSLLTGNNNVWADTGDISITYGHDPNVLVNPALFDASPLLSVWGYGDINLNDKTVSVNDVPIGRVILANAVNPESGQTYYTGNMYTFTIDPSALDTGDDIYGMYMDGNRIIGRGLKYTVRALTAYGYGPLTGTVSYNSEHAFDFEYGTADTFTIVNNNLQYEILRMSDVQTITGVLKYRIEVAYDGDRTITVTPYYTGTTFTEGIQPQGIMFELGHDTVYGDSTVSSLGTPLLIDLDIGEAYKEENGEIISSNTGVFLPAELPTLKAGSNTITFDNTVTQLKIVPRWWKV